MARRKNGTGSIRLRADGRWEGRYVVGYDDKGYPKTKCVLAKTKTDCLQKLKALKESCEEQKPSRFKPDVPFRDWLDYWYQNCCRDHIRPTTRQSYEDSIYRHIIPSLGDIPLNQLKQSKLQEFYNETKKGGRLLRTELYGEGLSNRTVRNCHLCCRGALEQAVKDGLLQSNPAYGCALPPKKAREMQVLAREEIQRFLIQAREEGYYELFLLELATGLRRGELLALQWSDLNFDTGELHITKQICRINGKLTVSEPKTKASNRTIILPPVLLGVLKKHRARTHSRWLFPSPRIEDQPLDPASCRKSLQRILNRAQCKRIRFHDLRHPYVKHTTKIFSLRSMAFQAQAYPDARRKTRGACQLLRVGQSRSPVRPLCNRKRFSCLPPQSKMSWILYAISMRLSGYTSTRSISSSASSVVSVSASKIALDASFRLSCRACSSCFCFACANTAA